MTTKRIFKVGDLVIATRDCYPIEAGKEYTVELFDEENTAICIREPKFASEGICACDGTWKLVRAVEETITIKTPKTKKTMATTNKKTATVNASSGAAKTSGAYEKIGTTYASPETLTVLRACIETSQPALLVGETGTGKTSLVRELAIEQKKDLIRVSLNGTTGIEEILGKWLAKDGSTVWQEGILLAAMREGKWIIFDEINAALPEVLFVLHSLLDDDRKVLIVEKDNEEVRPHQGFRFFASMNPPEDYAGTKDVNRALMSRFQAIIKVDPMPNDVEFAVIKDQTNADDAVATQLVQLGQMLRDAKAKGDIFYFCSTRDLLHSARLISAGCSVAEGIKYGIVHKMDKDEVKMVEAGIKGIVSLLPHQVRTISTLITTISTLEMNLREAQAAADSAQGKLKSVEATSSSFQAEVVKLRNEKAVLEKKVEKYTAELAKQLMDHLDRVNSEPVAAA